MDICSTSYQRNWRRHRSEAGLDRFIAYEEWLTCKPFTTPPAETKPIDNQHNLADWHLMQSLVDGALQHLQAKWRVPLESVTWTHDGLAKLLQPYASILDLEPGWDGDTASPILRETWNRAHDVLLLLVHALEPAGLQKIRSPEVFPRPDGGLDLTWPGRNAFLIIDIPARGEGNCRWAYRSRQGTRINNWLEPGEIDQFVLDFVRK